MRPCLTLIVALGIAVKFSKVSAESTPSSKSQVVMSYKGVFNDLFDPLSPSQKQQPYTTLVPIQLKDNDTFGSDEDDDRDSDNEEAESEGGKKEADKATDAKENEGVQENDDDGDDDDDEEAESEGGKKEADRATDPKENEGVQENDYDGDDDDDDDHEDDVPGNLEDDIEAHGDKYSKSILSPIAVDPPLPEFARRTHPVQPVRIRAKDIDKPHSTNKFYGNLMLKDSHAPLWTHPYGLRWESTGLVHHGLGISHIDDNSKSFGPPDEQIAAARATISSEHDQGDTSSKFYINPFLVSMGLSATELDHHHDMTIGDFGEFGCTMILLPAKEKAEGRLENPMEYIRIPIVRGMAFITGVYNNLTPRFFSTVLIRTVTLDTRFPSRDGWVKYRFLIENGITWLVYAKTDDNQSPSLRLEMRSPKEVVATSGKFKGLIQISKVPAGNEIDAETIYDRSIGTYATQGELVLREKYFGRVSGAYRIDWKLEGNPHQQFIHFTLPHHRAILTDKAAPTSLALPSTTKGKMVAYVGSTWHLYEPERVTVGFLPDGWSDNVTPEQLKVIREHAEVDSQRDFAELTDVDSMYFAGKGLAKFGLLCLVLKDVLKEEGLVLKKCLEKLKKAFSRFMENRQMFPLVYDTTWKGMISLQGLEQGPLADFGNSWYNDHHYHYGYFIHAAAIIRYMDPTWRTEELKTYVQVLLRDVANPSQDDVFFPVFRSFDWFMGHSWSQGVFVAYDGKDVESISEDINLFYAMSLWANVTEQPNLQHLGQIMLTVARRSIQSYFLLEDDNKNHPPVFVGNKVTGILFENKVDHTTYFSPRIECIQGIQMIPATPALPLVRRREFVLQEWESLLQDRVKEVVDGWKSVLMLNYGTLNKSAAWEYFTQEDSKVPLDDGMTRTWALFYVASQSL
ncbi:hypothetical protein BGZ83_009263 [Gryganskiella cystojenkinii]|nr:hypothetical protein BGZ83_009263 [Gryganskiella cystojenkinii]